MPSMYIWNHETCFTDAAELWGPRHLTDSQSSSLCQLEQLLITAELWWLHQLKNSPECPDLPTVSTYRKCISKLLWQHICKQLNEGLYSSAGWKASKLTYSETQLLPFILHQRMISLPEGSLRQLVHSKVGIRAAIDSSMGRQIAVHVSNLSISRLSVQISEHCCYFRVMFANIGM